MISRLLKNIKSKKITPDFEPSTKALVRILENIMEKGAESRTILSVKTNLNYSRFSKHIVWLEAKGLVKSEIDQSKIKIGLTKKGMEFASIISKDT